MAYMVAVSVVISLSSLLWMRWLMGKDVYAVRKGNRKVLRLFFLGGLASGPLCLVFYSINIFDLFYRSSSIWWPAGSKEGLWLPAGCFSLAVVLHGSYNTLLDYGQAGFALLLDFSVFVGLIMLMDKARQASPYRNFSKHDWRQAVGSLSAGIRCQPDNPDFLLRRGYYWLCGGQYRRACTPRYSVT